MPADDRQIAIYRSLSVFWVVGEKEKGTGKVVYDLAESSGLGHGFYFLNCVPSCVLESTLCNTE